MRVDESDYGVIFGNDGTSMVYADIDILARVIGISGNWFSAFIDGFCKKHGNICEGHPVYLNNDRSKISVAAAKATTWWWPKFTDDMKVDGDIGYSEILDEFQM